MMLRHLSRREHTVDELVEAMAISRRSVYRWLQYLREEGYHVHSRTDAEGVITYVVVQ